MQDICQHSSSFSLIDVTQKFITQTLTHCEFDYDKRDEYSEQLIQLVNDFKLARLDLNAISISDSLMVEQVQKYELFVTRIINTI